MKIIRAEHLGMCFGVRDAIALASQESEKQPVTILGELVHNRTVNATLRGKGIQIKNHLEEVGTHTVIVTAHGASETALHRARERGHHVLEATCPLVHFAHQSLANLIREGFHPVIIGKRDHVEVRGMTEDLLDYDVVLTEKEVLELKGRPRMGIVAQTTQPIERVQSLVEMMKERFPESEIRWLDTVCRPSKNRQIAAIALAQQCEVVVVIGGANSNNTRELAETCRRHCLSVVQVQDASELQPSFFYNACTVGITAGTSTPDHIIAGVEHQLRLFAGVERPEPVFEY